jgi:hypothetical protein
MAQARANLPKVLQNTEALKSLCKRILKLYIVRRKKDWDSVSGQAKSYGKFVLSVVSLGKYGSAELDTWRILNDCDEIKKEIEGATKYNALFNLIMTLHNKAISAKSEEVPYLSSPSLRTDTYYAIIALVQEILKLEFSPQYETDVADTFARLDREKNECRERFNSGLSPDESYKNIDELLSKLILLGARSAYFDGFGQNRNLFPHFKHTGGTAYVVQSDVNYYSQIIKVQMKQETGNPGMLVGFDVPNMNIPYQLQPGFPYIYLKKEHEENLESCANLALKDPSIRAGKSFYEQYAADPKIFTARNDPADATDIMADNETPPLSPDHSEDEGGKHALFQANITLAQELFAPNSHHASVDEEDSDDIILQDENEPAVVSPAPLLSVNNNNNSAEYNPAVVASPPPAPRVSVLGTFGAKVEQPSVRAALSPEQDVADEQLDTAVQESDAAVEDAPSAMVMQPARSKRAHKRK